MACLCRGRRRSSGRRAAEGRKGGHEAATEVEELGQKSAEREKRALEFIVRELSERGGLGEGGDEEEERSAFSVQLNLDLQPRLDHTECSKGSIQVGRQGKGRCCWLLGHQ